MAKSPMATFPNEHGLNRIRLPKKTVVGWFATSLLDGICCHFGVAIALRGISLDEAPIHGIPR